MTPTDNLLDCGLGTLNTGVGQLRCHDDPDTAVMKLGARRG